MSAVEVNGIKYMFTDKGQYFFEQLKHLKDTADDPDLQKLANLIGEYIFGPILSGNSPFVLWEDVEIRRKGSRRATKKLSGNRRKSVKSHGHA